MVREAAILNIKYKLHLFEYCSLSNLWWGRGNAGSSPPHSAPPPPRVANTQHSGDLSLSVPGSPTSEGWSPTGEGPASNGARRASWAGAALPRGRLLHATWGAAPWLTEGRAGGLPQREGCRRASGEQASGERGHAACWPRCPSRHGSGRGEGACVSVCVCVKKEHQAVQRQVARVSEGRTGQQLRPQVALRGTKATDCREAAGRQGQWGSGLWR